MQKEALSPLAAPPQARAGPKRTPGRPTRKPSTVTPKKAVQAEDVEMAEHTTPAAALGSVRNRVSRDCFLSRLTTDHCLSQSRQASKE